MYVYTSNERKHHDQGSKKVPSGCPGQVDFPIRQVTFHSHLPNGQGPRQVICQLNRKKSNLRLAQGKQNLRVTCPKGQAGIQDFFQALTVLTNQALLNSYTARFLWPINR